jgi:hypothetical protein
MSAEAAGARASAAPLARADEFARYHNEAAAHLRTAATYNELAAAHYGHGAYERAAHFGLLAHASMQHAGEYMSDAAKLHAELHGGNRHTVI